MNLKEYIRSIPDYPKKGILFRDITTLIKDENAFAETINQIVERSKKYNLFILLYLAIMNLKDYIRSIPDYPKKGILFRDITTLIKDENAFAETINQIVERSKKYNFTKIAAIESRGFVFASAVSYILKKPFIMLRKKNKLPADVHSIDFELEYGTATIEVHKDSLDVNDSVLIIDDLIATGGTAEAAAKLVEISNAKVASFVFVINLFDLGGSDNLIKNNYKVENLIDFPGH